MMTQLQHSCPDYEGFIAHIRYLTRMLSDKEILDKLRQFPRLNESGWDGSPEYAFVPESVDAIRCCMVWIADNTTKTQTIRCRHGSYAYKHYVEHAYSTKEYSQYIPNGAFIAAALIHGYRYRIYNRLNCHFNMSMPLAMQKGLRGY